MLEIILLCLTLNAYHEARGEPFHGQIAVNQVALRRAALQPENVCREIYRPDQFSWTAKQAPRKPKQVDGKAWHRAELAARAALVWVQHGIGDDYSRGATHYHATYVRPSWTRCARLVNWINGHKFYDNVQPCRGN